MKINTFFLCLTLLAFCSLNAQTTSTLADTVLAKRYLEEAKALIGAAKYDAALGKLDTAGVILEGTVGKGDMTYTKILDYKGRCFHEKGSYNQAEDYFQKALEIRLNKLGFEHLDVARSYNNLGNTYRSKNDYNRAIECYQKALVIRLKKLDTEHPEVASSYFNLGNAYINNGDYNRAIESHQKSLDIRLKKSGAEHLDVAGSYTGLGIAYWDKGDYDRSIEYHQKALEIWLKKLGPKHPDVAIPYNNLGNAHRAKGDYDRSIEYHQKALEIWLKKLDPKHPDVAIPYNNLGNTYGVKGDYDLAIEYLQKALEIRLKKLNPEHPDVASSYGNLGSAYMNKGDYDRAIEYYQRTLEIGLKKLGTEHPYVASSYGNLGNAHRAKRDYDRSIEYHQKALEIQLKKLGTEHPDVAISYNNLGNSYNSKSDYDRAIGYHQKALEIWLKILGTEHPNVATSYINFGVAYENKGDYNRAIDYYQKALKIQVKTLGIEHSDVANSYNYLGKLYKSQGNYSESSDYFNKALLSINAFRKTLENPSSKSTLAKESTGIYEGGIATNYLLHQRTDSLHYLHEAFHYAEQSKALSLYESIKNADALHLAGIPDSLLQKEYDLRVDICYNEKRRQDLYTEGKEETDSTVLKISSKLFDINRAYEQLIDTFEIRYPDYYRLKYDFRTEDVSSIQRDLLQPGQAMLMYHVGDSSIFIFLLKKDDYRVIEVKKDFPLEDWVRRLRHGIYGYRRDPLQHDTLAAFAAEEYTKVAWLLYQKLLAPVDSLLPRRVVIIPDGVLGYVPFEALLTEKPAKPQRFQNHPYFCLQHDLSYCYSATLLREMIGRQHRQEPSGAFLAVAPAFDGDTALLAGRRIDLTKPANRLPPLKHAKEEALELSRIMGGTALVGKDATEDAFAQQAGQYGIVHLATHGKANDQSGDYSFLAFAEVKDSLENEWLYVREVYNLALNADLVTLSACETGIGELKRGEGIISLARAFSYAGAKSIVTTLWSVDDARTKDLMIAFYRNLKKGMTKDAALAQAQRDFLATHKGSNAHPFFWAGFVAIGDVGVVSGQ